MADRISSPLLQLEDAALGYGEPVLDKIDIGLFPEDRIGLLGHNGAGKSTFLKSLAGQIPLVSGIRREGHNVQVGYFSQQQVDSLDLNRSAADHILALAPTTSEQQIRNYLGGYDFRGDRISEPVHHFSGGEKARLALAMVAFVKPNLLLLDEPTNHLDMDMCQALTMALQSFCEPRTWPQAWPGGAIVLISHDQHLLANCVDQFLLVDHGEVSVFDGDLTDYRNYLFDQETPASQESAEPAPSPAAPPKQNHKAARQLRTRIKTLEQSLGRLQRKLSEVETALAAPDVYESDTGASLQQLLRDQLAIQEQIDAVENDWLEQSSVLEAMT
jgi:ATP-binding cassette subfamily F protein 3